MMKPQVVIEYLFVFINFLFWQHRTDREIKIAWPVLFSQATEIWDSLSKVQEGYRIKYLRVLMDVMDNCSSRELDKVLPPAIILLTKIFATSLRRRWITGWELTDLIKSLHPLNAAFVHAPETSWRQLEKGYVEHDWSLTQDGLELMLTQRRLKLFTVKCFHFFPNKLFKLCRKLGALPEGRAIQILAEFQRHPILQQGLKRKKNLEIIHYFRDHKNLVNPVPRKMQDLIEIPGALSQLRLTQYRKEIYRNLHMTRLAIFDGILHQQLLLPGPPREEEIYQHASLILAGTRANRRAVRRFLREYSSGKKDYLFTHPRTQRWLAAHKHIDVFLWMNGIELIRDVEGFGLIRLELEQNPLEVWKLGTYVRSCLAVGGINQQYAAAVMLDINKQVLYARDAKGRVVARQLLAVSEEEKLVCFSVYPLKVDERLKKLFREYDIQFAKALQLPLTAKSEAIKSLRSSPRSGTTTVPGIPKGVSHL